MEIPALAEAAECEHHVTKGRTGEDEMALNLICKTRRFRKTLALCLATVGFCICWNSEANAQNTRNGTVSVGRHIAFQLEAWDADKATVKIVVAPQGIVESSFDGYFLRVKGLKQGSAVITVTGRIEGKVASFKEDFAVLVDAERPMAYLPPRTVRDHFMALSEDYFVLEGCDWEHDQDCESAKREYLKSFLLVEDTRNGYLKAGCDGAQSCLEMAIFKRTDSTYLVAINVSSEEETKTRFLRYIDSKWQDLSRQVVPEFSGELLYEIPRKGTTVHVFERKQSGEGDLLLFEKGQKLYDLVWDGNAFTIRSL